MDILVLIRAVIVFIAAVLCCVGTGVAQFKNGGTRAYLYGFTVDGGDVVKYKDTLCNAYSSRFDAAYAFAIISCIVIGFCFFAILGRIFLRTKDAALGLASLGLSVFGMISSLIAWSIVVALFHGTWCGVLLSFNDQGFDLVGAALLIVTWILMVIDSALAVVSFIRRPVVDGNEAKV